ncbi:unnamed protein product [Bemisia tabaci]|uniref:Neural proliferation differentiation and control protein 1 n=1 Tax=Bemisia tabaci TaxID=7038 RepID=A0A9P0G633_BEMTA|nr:unnamed protein product [Bemisia tabaci]
MLFSLNMNLILIEWLFVLICNCALVNSIYYTGLSGLGGLSEEDRIVAKLANIIKEREERWSSTSDSDPEGGERGGEREKERERGRKPGLLFSYHFPNQSPENNESPFAVPPTDPRYHQNLAPDALAPQSESSASRGSQRNYVVDTQRYETPISRNPNSAKTRLAHTFEDSPYSEGNKYSSKESVPMSNMGQFSSKSSDDEDDEENEGSMDQKESRSEPSPPARFYQFERVIKTPLFLSTENWDSNDMYYMVMIAGCSAAAVLGLSILGFGWYRLQKRVKAAADVDYPAYGVTGPHKDSSPTGDRRLAHSAQMYHYQHQKQQIIAMENGRSCNEARRGSVSEAESDEEGDYTVYECPGLAVAGEMEVKNPLFNDEPITDLPKPEEASIKIDETKQAPNE